MHTDQGISVLIVTHNRAHLITKTIESVLQQTFKDFELIIIDDGSTDTTEQVINAINDHRITYHKFPRIGRLTRLRNIAVNKSNKKYVAFIDSDDLWHPEKLEKCLNACKNNFSTCLTDCREFDGSGKIKESRGHQIKNKQVDIRREILIKNLPLTYGSNIFFKKQLFESVQFDEKLYVGDHDFLLSAMFQGSYTYIPEVLTSIRRHNGNMTNINKNELIAVLEYNRSMRKFRKKNLVTEKEYKMVISRNYYILAGYYLHNSAYRRFYSYLLSAMLTKVRVKKMLNLILECVKKQFNKL